MFLADNWKDFEIIDTSWGEKLERWGDYILIRPDPQVIWNTPKDKEWKNANARYIRSNKGGGYWENSNLPDVWSICYKDLKFNLKPMGFKHTGLFPEQAVNWDFMREKIRGRENVKALN
ncbi:MAG: SAM-dependent methyltransferase, partial [Clostridia bacterium]|nr:SAM-dependent methyltransferase [Clostridia bacterium]